MGQRQRIEVLAADVLATPPGGWGESAQAVSRLAGGCMFWDRRGRTRYRLPSGDVTALEARAVEAWLAHVEAQGARVHPGRVPTGEVRPLRAQPLEEVALELGEA